MIDNSEISLPNVRAFRIRVGGSSWIGQASQFTIQNLVAGAFDCSFTSNRVQCRTR